MVDMTGEYRIAAPRDQVWSALNDPDTLGQCIPGCEFVERSGADSFTGRAVIAVGPVKAKFSGKVTLTDLNPPSSYRLIGEGAGGVAGFGKGGATVSLTEAGPDVTILTYVAEAQVGGKLAQIGSRLIQSSAKKIADEFFARFAAKMTETAEGMR